MKTYQGLSVPTKDAYLGERICGVGMQEYDCATRTVSTAASARPTSTARSTPLKLLADAQPDPAGIFVEPGPTGSVYWVNHVGGTVRRMAKDGTGATTLAAGQLGPITVTADDTNVYWATQMGEVWRTAK